MKIASLAIVVVVAAVAVWRAQSLTQVDDLEATGNVDSTGEIAARSGVRLASPTTGPSISSGAGDPNGAQTATRASLWIRTDTAQVYQNTDGAQAWTHLGAGGSSSEWQLVLDDPLTGGSLTGWNQRVGAWTADANGFHVNAGATSECYLSYESGGAEGAPFPMHGTIMEFEASWPVGSATSDLLGAVVFGQAGLTTNPGTTRVAYRRDGALIALSGYPANTALANPGIPTTPVGTWITMRLISLGTHTDMWINGTYYFGASMQINYAITRLGLWANPCRASFRNLKIYRLSDPSL